MERHFEIDGREHTGTVGSEQGASFRPGAEGFVAVTLDGVERRVEIIDRDAHRLDLIVDGVRRVVVHTASVTGDAGAIWVGGRGWTRRARSAETRAASVAGDDQRKVTPLFPAKVVKIHVEVGQHVVKGQPVVTVTAMKMELTLTAPRDGTVSAVNTREQAQVSPGEILVEIEEIGDE